MQKQTKDDVGQEVEYLRARLEEQKRWLVKAGEYIAASAEWFAEVKNVPMTEMRRHYRICEMIDNAIGGDPPPAGRYPSDYNPSLTRERLTEVANRLRKRVGES